jgi:hypothetical protein
LTIASCYLSPEGVVLGADSTSTYTLIDGNHYFNHAQKIFEIGENSTIGLVTWGLGGLIDKSYRTLVAQLNDDLVENPPSAVEEVANRWIDMFWDAYNAAPLISNALNQLRNLDAKKPFHPNELGDPSYRTEVEEREYVNLRNGLVVGFCIGGYVLPKRDPLAYEVVVDPIAGKPKAVSVIGNKFWGAPNMINRLLFGCDDPLLNAILTSGHWTGTDADLISIVNQHALTHPVLPIREAIDFVHSCIFSTIKALKFSNFSQICGGPIEIGLITTDRRFRWVRHKPWDTAIVEGEI